MLLLLSAKMMDFIAKTNKMIILCDYTVPCQAKNAVANHANKSSSTRIHANLGLVWFGAK
jgi:hypothetical protein